MVGRATGPDRRTPSSTWTGIAGHELPHSRSWYHRYHDVWDGHSEVGDASGFYGQTEWSVYISSIHCSSLADALYVALQKLLLTLNGDDEDDEHNHEDEVDVDEEEEAPRPARRKRQRKAKEDADEPAPKKARKTIATSSKNTMVIAPDAPVTASIRKRKAPPISPGTSNSPEHKKPAAKTRKGKGRAQMPDTESQELEPDVVPAASDRSSTDSRGRRSNKSSANSQPSSSRSTTDSQSPKTRLKTLVAALEDLTSQKSAGPSEDRSESVPPRSMTPQVSQNQDKGVDSRPPDVSSRESSPPPPLTPSPKLPHPRRPRPRNFIVPDVVRCPFR